MTIAPQPDGITCKIGAKPTEAIAAFQQIQAIVGADWSGQIHAASGLGRLTFLTLSADEVAKVRSLLQANSGFLSILQAPAALKQQIDVWGDPGSALPLMRRIKHQFDPHALLSPHRFVGGI